MDPNRDNRAVLIRKAQLCPYCDGRPKLTDSKVIYGENTDYGMMWLCGCGAYVGCHPGTNKPLGRVADAELRKWKGLAHKHFDFMWKNSARINSRYYNNARHKAYTWLSERMGIDRRYTHIGMFDIEQCKQVIELCKDYSYIF